MASSQVRSVWESFPYVNIEGYEILINNRFFAPPMAEDGAYMWSGILSFQLNSIITSQQFFLTK